MSSDAGAKTNHDHKQPILRGEGTHCGANRVCVCVCVCVWISPKLNHVVTKKVPRPPPTSISSSLQTPGPLIDLPGSHCPKVRLDYWPKPCEGSPQWPQLIFYTNFGLMRGLQHCVNTATEKGPCHTELNINPP